MAGNRIATAIGGPAPFELTRRGAMMKKAAARVVMNAHCLAILVDGESMLYGGSL
jgi:hypothetical protein